MSSLEIDTGNGNVLDCVEVVEDVVMKHGDEIDVMCWQRLRARLTPDRERVARAIHDANTTGLKGEDVWLARADAAIAAMGETP